MRDVPSQVKEAPPMFRNAMPRYEVLSEDAMATLDAGWRRLVTEVGVEFMSDRALDLFRKAGQRVEENTVFLDPDFVLEQVAKAPREFDVAARNPANSVHIGGDSMAFGAVYGPPFVREGEVRRDATMEDFRNFTKLAQSFAVLDSAGGVICEPNDTPLDSRHLDMTYALQTLTDKIYMGNVVSGVNARDTIEMSSILFGGREVIEQTPVTISLINCNSPLRWDDRMLDAQFEYSAANQAVVLTPFILMGAMSPVTIPAALVQQIAEALSGIALSQLIRPGCPVIFGSFLSNIDMQSGSPTFGTPESAMGLLCTGQIARHFGLPFRSGGGDDVVAGARRAGRLRGADDADADVPGRRELGDALGRLARGRARRRLREVHRRHRAAADDARAVHAAGDRRGLAGLRRARRGRARRALPRRDAHDGALPHLLLPAAAVVLGELRALDAQRRRRRRRAGRRRSTRRSSRSTRPPPLDDAIRAELEEYVVRRRAELGD